METIRSYLQLTRLHTAPLETVPALLGAMLATGGEINILVLLWGFFGLLYHAAGYGMNSIVDWMKGYDRLDRNKQHHPLNRGSIKLERAALFIVGLFFVLIALGVGLARGEYLALTFMVLGAIAGVAYNTIGKETPYKFLLISFAHTTVFIVPYLAMGGDIFTMEFRLAALYIFLWVAFQISVSGEIKDIHEIGESNYLRDTLGVTIKKRQFRMPDSDILIFSHNSRLYSLGIKCINLMLGAFILLTLIGSVFSYTPLSLIWLGVWGFLSVVTIANTTLLVRDGEYNRSNRIRRMSVIELVTLFIFISALYPIIGLGAVVTLIVGSVVWVLGLNRVEWGTWIAPDV